MYWLQNLDAKAEFDSVFSMLEIYVNEARLAGVPAGYIHADEDSIRGVDAPMEKLVYSVEDSFGALADENGVCLSALNDPYNQWTEITPSSQSKGQAYRLAAKVWDKVCETKTLSEASDILSQAGCKLHGYCAID